MAIKHWLFLITACQNWVKHMFPLDIAILIYKNNSRYLKLAMSDASRIVNSSPWKRRMIYGIMFNLAVQSCPREQPKFLFTFSRTI